MSAATKSKVDLDVTVHRSPAFDFFNGVPNEPIDLAQIVQQQPTGQLGVLSRFRCLGHPPKDGRRFEVQAMPLITDPEMYDVNLDLGAIEEVLQDKTCAGLARKWRFLAVMLWKDIERADSD